MAKKTNQVKLTGNYITLSFTEVSKSIAGHALNGAYSQFEIQEAIGENRFFGLIGEEVKSDSELTLTL